MIGSSRNRHRPFVQLDVNPVNALPIATWSYRRYYWGYWLYWYSRGAILLYICYSVQSRQGRQESFDLWAHAVYWFIITIYHHDLSSMLTSCWYISISLVITTSLVITIWICNRQATCYWERAIIGSGANFQHSPWVSDLFMFSRFHAHCSAEPFVLVLR